MTIRSNPIAYLMIRAAMRTHRAHCFRSATANAITIAWQRNFLALLSTLALGAVLLAAPLRAQFVYVTNQSDSTISGYSIDSNGALTPVSGSPFPAEYYPSYLAFDSAAGLLYSGNQSTNINHDGVSGTITWYSIDSSGALTSASGSPLVIDNITPYSLAINSTGKFLYLGGTGLNTGEVPVYSIGSGGALTAIQGSPFKSARYPVSLVIDPNANFTYVADSIRNSVSGYKIRSNGALKPVTGSPFSVGKRPLSIAIDPSGSFLVVANLSSNNISVESIGSDGALTQVTGSPFENRGGPTSIVISPKGEFVYVTNENNNTVSGYKLGSDGSLTRVPNSPFATGSVPFGLAVDSTGKFLYVANYGGNSVSGNSINSDGSLAPLPGSPYPAGTLPRAVLVTP
jgi:6-phosphogluconolactonase (cycloisomerase 2 family)